MAKIVIEVNADGEYCGDCKFQGWSRFQQSVICNIFNNIELTIINPCDVKRCNRCIESEFEASIEESLGN